MDARPGVTGYCSAAVLGWIAFWNLFKPNWSLSVKDVLVQIPLRNAFDSAHYRRFTGQQIGVHGQVSDDGVFGQPANPLIGNNRLAGIAPLCRIDQYIGLFQPGF